MEAIDGLVGELLGRIGGGAAVEAIRRPQPASIECPGECGRAQRLPGASRKPLRFAFCVTVIWLAACGLALAQPAPDASPAVPPAAAPPATAPLEVANPPTESTVTPATKALSFAESVLGSSLEVGVARTDPTFTLHPEGQPDVVVEEYTEQGATGGSLAYAGSTLDLLSVPLGHGFRITAFGLNWTGGLGTFSAHQTLQPVSSGAVAPGGIDGQYLYAAGQLNQWLLWEGDRLPGALHVWDGWGLGLLRFDGALDYTVSGTDYAGRLQNYGYTPQFVQTFGIELRLRQVLISASGFEMSRNGLTGAPSALTTNGVHVANYPSNYVSRIYSISYVINL